MMHKIQPQMFLEMLPTLADFLNFDISYKNINILVYLMFKFHSSIFLFSCACSSRTAWTLRED